MAQAFGTFWEEQYVQSLGGQDLRADGSVILKRKLRK